MAHLDIYSDPHTFRMTSIICTIGPKTNSVEMLTKLRNAGMNIVRLNFSHGSHEFHGSIIKNTRESLKQYPGGPVAIALDTKGPEIRTGMLKGDQEILLEKDSFITITTNDDRKNDGDKDTIYVDYKNLPKIIPLNGLIYIDDGLISLEVQEKTDTSVKAKVLNSGKLGSKKGVNLPDSDVDLPAVSEKDKEDLRFGVEQGVDMVFASFIRKAQDVRDVRTVLGEDGKDILIISKIENHEGVRNFGEILAESDGIMAARGDLGIEIPPEKVFLAQKFMISRCNLAAKPIICATQMLESMTYNPRPTRAEISDVANAVLDGSDCVMLSGETAKGNYPVETVSMMAKICREAEAAVFYSAYFAEMRSIQSKQPSSSHTETLALSAASASFNHEVGAIVVLTQSGETARLIAKYRPRCPIFTVTRSAKVARKVHLYRGCFPLYYEQPVLPIWQDDVDARFQWAIEAGKERGVLRSGDWIIGIQGWKGGKGNTNTLRLLIIP